jgi:hypothetical protein
MGVGRFYRDWCIQKTDIQTGLIHSKTVARMRRDGIYRDLQRDNFGCTSLWTIGVPNHSHRLPVSWCARFLQARPQQMVRNYALRQVWLRMAVEARDSTSKMSPM